MMEKADKRRLQRSVWLTYVYMVIWYALICLMICVEKRAVYVDNEHIFLWNRDFYFARYAAVFLICFALMTAAYFLAARTERMRGVYRVGLRFFQAAVQFFVLIAGVWIVERMTGSLFFSLARQYQADYFLFATMLWVILFALTNRVMAANILYLLVTVSYGTVNAIVNFVRGFPVQPQDIASFSAAKNIVSSYDIKLTGNIAFSLLFFILVLILVFAVDYTGIRNPKVRIGFAAVCLILVTGFWVSFVHSDFISNRLALFTDAWNPKGAYGEQGNFVGFIADAKKMRVTEPDGYNREQISLLLDTYDDADSSEGKACPNIIVIMNESFADLSVVGEFETTKPYLENWYGLKENTIHGNLYVSVAGGYTADSEFEFLTGNTTAYLPNIGFSYIRKPYDSVVTQLRDQGYLTYGMHPYLSSGYNRIKIYDYLQFDRKLFVENFDTEGAKYIRSYVYISDESNYRRLIEEYEKSDGDAPVFVFNVTIQNHGSYESGLDTVQVKGMENIPMTNEYLSCIRASDEAFRGLIDYFENVDEDTIILMFGDHQPNIEEEFYDYLYGKDSDSLSLSELQKRYEVPFLIWANYDIEERDDVNISANYLYSYLLNTAGVELSAYNRYLLTLYKTLPVMTAHGYMAADGKWYSYDEENVYTPLLEEYRRVEYNHMFDCKGLEQYYQIKK